MDFGKYVSGGNYITYTFLNIEKLCNVARGKGEEEGSECEKGTTSSPYIWRCHCCI